MTYHDRDPIDSHLMTPASPDGAPLDRTGEDPTPSIGPMPMTARTVRRSGLFKRLATAIALTLMLSAMLLSMTASPASARRSDYANRLIEDCFNSGGDPNAIYIGGTYYVSCDFDDMSWWQEA